MDLIKVINYKLSKYRSPLEKIQNNKKLAPCTLKTRKAKRYGPIPENKTTENKTNNKNNKVKDMLQKYINGEKEYIRKTN